MSAWCRSARCTGGLLPRGSAVEGRDAAAARAAEAAWLVEGHAVVPHRLCERGERVHREAAHAGHERLGGGVVHARGDERGARRWRLPIAVRRPVVPRRGEHGLALGGELLEDRELGRVVAEPLADPPRDRDGLGGVVRRDPLQRVERPCHVVRAEVHLEPRARRERPQLFDVEGRLVGGGRAPGRCPAINDHVVHVRVVGRGRREQLEALVVRQDVRRRVRRELEQRDRVAGAVVAVVPGVREPVGLALLGGGERPATELVDRVLGRGAGLWLQVRVEVCEGERARAAQREGALCHEGRDTHDASDVVGHRRAEARRALEPVPHGTVGQPPALDGRVQGGDEARGGTADGQHEVARRHRRDLEAVGAEHGAHRANHRRGGAEVRRERVAGEEPAEPRRRRVRRRRDERRERRRVAWLQHDAHRELPTRRLGAQRDRAHGHRGQASHCGERHGRCPADGRRADRCVKSCQQAGGEQRPRRQHVPRSHRPSWPARGARATTAG